MKRFSIAALAVAAALSGCATTDSQDTNAAAPAPEARSGQASTSPSTGTASSSSIGSRSGGTGSRSSGQAQGQDLKRSVYFEFDKYDVKPEYRALVEEHARWLKANPKAKLVVEGNADERGSREYNVALGQRRAESVTKMLVLMGAKAEQIEAVSWGEEKPRRTGHDETSWAENRRDDFVRR
jgi:peptidoglycan-associated lipoprotein